MFFYFVSMQISTRKCSYLMKYYFTKHHEHELFVLCFTFKIHQASQIEPPSGPLLPTAHMSHTPDI